MNIKQFLARAAEDNVIDASTHDKLVAYQGELSKNTAGINWGHIMSYGGILVAMLFVMALLSISFNWNGMLGAVVVFGALALFLAERNHSAGNGIATGIWSTFTVINVPVAVGLIIIIMQVSPDNMMPSLGRSDLLIVESAALVSGLLAFWRYRESFLLLPVSLAFWAVMQNVLDTSGSVFIISLMVGVILLPIAFIWDINNKKPENDFPFWLYAVGCLALLIGAVDQSTFTAFVAGIVFLAFGSMLARSALTAFGAIGVFIWIADLLMQNADNTNALLVVIVVALAVSLAGFFWSKNRHVISANLRKLLPESVQETLNKRA